MRGGKSLKVARVLLLAAVFPAAGLWAGQNRLTLAGSSTVQPIMDEAADAFEARRPGARVDVQGGGSSVGISAPLRGLADIGMVSRDLREDEEEALVPTAVALDGLALIVHASNPLRNFTREQVVDIYTGRVSDWSGLGWDGGPIVLVNKEEGRATLELFEDYFGLKGRFARGALIIGPNGQALATVAGNPGAVAYVSIGAAAAAERDGAAVRRVALNGVEASVENVDAGAYGLCRRLHLVTRGRPRGLAKEFIDFVLGPEGRAIVARQEFVPPPAGGPRPEKTSAQKR
ncbi:MAG: phosphate ABC transporter substrate-binding protein [Elusimicrobiota bacterium]